MRSSFHRQKRKNLGQIRMKQINEARAVGKRKVGVGVRSPGLLMKSVDL